MVRLIIFILFSFITSYVYSSEYINPYYGIVEICFSFDGSRIIVVPSPIPPPKPEPNPTPSPYKCQKCKDQRYIIHGDGHKSPCPDCNSSENIQNTLPVLIISEDFKNVIIDGKIYPRKKPMQFGEWVGIDKWKVCYGRSGCKIYIIKQEQMGLNIEEYNVY